MSDETFGNCAARPAAGSRPQRGRPSLRMIEHAPPWASRCCRRRRPATSSLTWKATRSTNPVAGSSISSAAGSPMTIHTFARFGAATAPHEKTAFEAFVDFVVERRRRYPNLHVYHYAPYEKTAMRKLAQTALHAREGNRRSAAGRSARRSFAVVRQALVVSEERYGLKSVEKFYDAEARDRRQERRRVDRHVRGVVGETRRPRFSPTSATTTRTIANRRTVLREWLLARRDEAIAAFGVDVPLRPVKAPNEPCHARVYRRRLQKVRQATRRRARRGTAQRPRTQAAARRPSARNRKTSTARWTPLERAQLSARAHLPRLSPARRETGMVGSTSIAAKTSTDF